MSEQKVQNNGAEPRWATFMHHKAAALGIPLAGNFELTSRCNFNCKMCYVHDNANKNELSAEEWIALGKEAVNNGMMFLLLTGGEPFLRKDFPKIYRGLKELGLLISINTNGSLIDDELFDLLKHDPPLRMNISLYGACNETYRQLCGQAAFDKVTENILRLKDAGIQVKLNGSITPYNAGDIPALYSFAEENGLVLKATTYMFPPVRVNGCKFGEACHRFTAEEAAEQMLLCREQFMTPAQLKSSAGRTREIDDCTGTEREPMHCRAGKSAFWVTWDGRMLPCGMFPDEGYRLKEIGFRNAWDAVRKDVQTVRLPAKCTACPDRPSCAACAASVLTETGGLDTAPEYICRMTKHLRDLTARKYGSEEAL